ncbi:MAG TPA: glycosyltransferase family 4 protein [Gemmatimonadales bacterium]|nr:glycosyltransferase family 4 protein [Gemmatimonadales bacterium]
MAFAASLLLSAAVLRYARSRALLDVPTTRSSHTRPTPRGGGLGMVLVVLGGVALLTTTGRLAVPTGIALLGGGTIVAAIGWLDDLKDISAAARLAAHAVAALWAVVWLGGLPSLTVGTEAVRMGAAGGVLAVLGVVWATNLYNFMDGIDGLAAGEAASVGLVGAMLLASRHPGLAAVAAIVMGAAAGFLPWNWQPARIFMGDVGSGFLGFVLAALAVASENTDAVPALVWLLLLGIFFADATITLVRRMARRERWYAAHRGHAYQRATQAGGSHARVTSAVLVLNGGLAGLAWLGLERPQLLPSLLLLAAALLTGLYLLVERWRPMPRESPAGSMEKPVL